VHELDLPWGVADASWWHLPTPSIQAALADVANGTHKNITVVAMARNIPPDSNNGENCVQLTMVNMQHNQHAVGDGQHGNARNIQPTFSQLARTGAEIRAEL
ncbi:hypothetical protein M405DRAFT_848338, partial [Rhizopogon salebrosus TDB-379]